MTCLAVASLGNGFKVLGAELMDSLQSGTCFRFLKWSAEGLATWLLLFSPFLRALLHITAFVVFWMNHRVRLLKWRIRDWFIMDISFQRAESESQLSLQTKTGYKRYFQGTQCRFRDSEELGIEKTPTPGFIVSASTAFWGGCLLLVSTPGPGLKCPR